MHNLVHDVMRLVVAGFVCAFWGAVHLLVITPRGCRGGGKAGAVLQEAGKAAAKAAAGATGGKAGGGEEEEVATGACGSGLLVCAPCSFTYAWITLTR